MKLRRYGFFRELAHGDKDGQSIVAIRGSAHYSETLRETIVKYLESGHLLIGCPGISVDIFRRDDDRPIGSPDVLTDGRWAWPGDLGYYVRHYNVPVAEDMFNHMKSNGWAIPPHLDLSGVEL